MLKKPWATAFGFAAWVGLDWAKEKHAVSMKDIDSGQRERCEVGSTPEAIELWLICPILALGQRFAGKRKLRFDRRRERQGHLPRRPRFREHPDAVRQALPGHLFRAGYSDSPRSESNLRLASI